MERKQDQGKAACLPEFFGIEARKPGAFRRLLSVPPLHTMTDACIEAIIAAGDSKAVFEDMKHALCYLAYLDEEKLVIADSTEKPEDMVSTAVSGVSIYLKLHDEVDAEAEKARLNAELKEIQGQVDRLEKLLASPFAEKAPAAVVDKERARLAQFKETAANLEGQLASL